MYGQQLRVIIDVLASRQAPFVVICCDMALVVAGVSVSDVDNTGELSLC